MKKLFILLLIIPILGFSQNDLVFNQVSIVVLDFNGITVPDGKVWKIESADGQYLLVDDDNWELGRLGSYNNMPAWFPEGTILKKGSGSSTGSSPISRLSVLEFYVVAASSSSGSSSSSSGGYNGPPTGTGGDSFNDNDGNSQETTVTAGQTWSTSNASHKTYRDGTPIPQITDYTEWENASTGAWTYYLQDEALGIVMYNGHAIKGKYDNDLNTPNKQFAPEGWRVPTLSDYVYLFENYGAAVTYGYAANNNTYNNNYPSANYPVPTGIFGGNVVESIKSQTGWAYDINGTNASGLDFKPTGTIIGENFGFSSEPTELISNTAISPPYTQGYAYNNYSRTYGFSSWTSTSNVSLGGLYSIFVSIATTNVAPQNLYINSGNDSDYDYNYGATTRLIKTN